MCHLILAVSTDTFLSRQNLLNLFAKAASSQVMALGMALVLLSGYFDLTGGAVVVLSLVGCFRMLPPLHIFPAGTEIFGELAVGILLGVLSGTFVVYCKMPSLLTSLVLIQIFRGLAFKLLEGDKISEMSRPFRWIGTVVTSGGIPVAAILVLLLTVMHAGHFAENGSGISCQRDWSECRNCGNSRSPCKKGRMEAICFCWFLLWSFGHSVGRKSRSNQFFTGRRAGDESSGRSCSGRMLIIRRKRKLFGVLFGSSFSHAIDTAM